MSRQLQYKRLLTMAVVLSVAFAGLGYRLVDLQVLRHEELSKEAKSNTQYTYRLEPRRGDIRDTKGNLLATSIFVKTVCADPVLVGNRQAEVAHAIAPLLQMNEADLVQRLIPRTKLNDKGETVTNRYVVLKRKVSTDAWDRVRDTMAKLSFGLDEKKLSRNEQSFYRYLREKAIATDPVDDQLRAYPNQNMAAHVLGYVGMVERTNSNGSRSLDSVGIDGIERMFDAKLKGVRGLRVTERDRQQRELVAMREQDVEPHDGLNVVLTIDSVIQHIVEMALAEGMEKNSPISISGIVVRPRTGEILAMATLPNFDPNDPGRNPDAAARRNRMIADIVEPGSTFKIVVVSGALNDGTVSLSDQFDCEHGLFYYAGKALHDHESYGVLSVLNIITKSSNIGAAKIGIKMGEPRLFEYVHAFGFGTHTGIPLPGEARGIVHNLTNWNKLSISRIPMGHEVCVTPLQMAMAMSAVANKGVLMRPMLVDRLEEQDGSVALKYQPQPVRRVINEAADNDIITALKSVVTSDGTAVKANMTNYTVAGKTGTAQKSDGIRYLDGKFFASFVGFFPADNPEVCIYVALDEPKGGHYGGQTAAPVFKRIAEQVANYLNIRPDKNIDPALPEGMARAMAGADGPLRAASVRVP